MPLKECMRQHTLAELAGWEYHFQEELKTPTPDQWYMAGIALEVRRKFSQKPNDHKLEHLTIDFFSGKKKKVDQSEMTFETEEEKQAYLDRISAEQRAVWNVLIPKESRV